MSYQVLARKWRPRNFSEMVGQEHVLRALINALDNDRVHHAFLFTGTRGVGKTTIARILAKSLNCEQGVTSTPCGECAACTEIDEGRFIDLIEVDAASRTKVEDTRELLENVQYAPTRGRYKVYLVDEVHMLSNHSFNALLKTLEEPPPHVKFLLATTDPQKLPVTILSRCLQFNLKRLPVSRIGGYLELLLGKEAINFDQPALGLLARAADGSMRDALSLLDQAIAFGGGIVSEAETRAMLGTIEQEHVIELVSALADQDPQPIFAKVEQLSEFSPDYAGLLNEVITLLHRIALAQTIPEAIDDTYGDRDAVIELANRFDAEELQLYYQIALIGRRDLPLAPVARSGFEMVLLRMLAFSPEESGTTSGGGDRPVARREAAPRSTPRPARTEAAPSAAPAASQPGVNREAVSEPTEGSSPISRARSALSAATAQKAAQPAAEKRPSEAPVSQAPVAEPETPPAATAAKAPLPPECSWPDVVTALGLSGASVHLANNCLFVEADQSSVTLQLDPAAEHLRSQSVEQRLHKGLENYLGKSTRLVIKVEKPVAETPAQAQVRNREERHQAAVESMQKDINVKEIVDVFDATLHQDSVRPIDY